MNPTDNPEKFTIIGDSIVSQTWKENETGHFTGNL